LAPVADYEALLNDNARVMSSAIRRVLGRRHRTLVPAVEQEVRLALWKRIQTGKKIDHPVSYVYKAALTTALGVVKRLAPETAPLDEGTMENVGTGQTDSPGNLLPAERTRLIEEMLDKLNVDQSRALRGYLSGLNHREVATLYGWSESVARHRIYRGLETLKSLSHQQ
jgi:RNA polymerase sigma factor (sigma-70 family)